MPFIARNPERYLGKVVGTGHCINYVRETTGAPITTQWRRGDPVRGSGCSPGTAIATFDPSGRYGNHVDGRSHAAILIAETDEGLLVCDQWVGQPVHHRTIRYRDGEGDAANDASRYYVIEMA
jgi:hypothetical protein